MSVLKKPLKLKSIKAELTKELQFIKNIFSMLSLPVQMKGDGDNISGLEITNRQPKKNELKNVSERARNIAELEEKLQKVKSQNKFNLKSKLAKKSLTSKLNKKIKKRERLNKTKIKSAAETLTKSDIKQNLHVNVAKPVFNNDGKVVFSKFDFANTGKKDRPNKTEKDPKKILEKLEQQKKKFQELEETENKEKAEELKEKIAWKNVFQKAEGQKVKDDPILLKKSIKKMEQKKKHSKKQWDNRIKGVEQKKEDRQKKRSDNIAKKKKEKKSKIVKAAAKRGRVVI